MVTIYQAHPQGRDSEAMRGRILKALERIILRDGLSQVGINAIAREAGCDKVLIYRYFGDLDGLYAAFAERSDFWWTVSELTNGVDPEGMTLADAVGRLLRRHAEAIRARPVTLAVLAAELEARSALVVALETVRERRSLELNAWVAARYALPKDRDVAAMTMLLGVALNYLAARARKIRVMGGVGIESEADWERLLDATQALVDAAFGKG